MTAPCFYCHGLARTESIAGHHIPCIGCVRGQQRRAEVSLTFDALARAFAEIGYAVKWWSVRHSRWTPDEPPSVSEITLGVFLDCPQCQRAAEAIDWYEAAIVEGRAITAPLHAPDNAWVNAKADA